MSNPRPASVDAQWAWPGGDLICADCGQILKEDTWEGSHDAWFAYSHHYCPKWPFVYDFNSPMTMREQYMKAKEKTAIIDRPKHRLFQ